MLIKCRDCWHEDYAEYIGRNAHYERVCPNCGSTELDIPPALRYSPVDSDEPTDEQLTEWSDNLRDTLKEIALCASPIMTKF